MRRYEEKIPKNIQIVTSYRHKRVAHTESAKEVWGKRISKQDLKGKLEKILAKEPQIECDRVVQA